MLLYDWKKIMEATEGYPSSVILVLRMMTEGLIPKNKYDPIYKFHRKSFKGSSFLVHPDVLLYNRYKYEPVEIAQYLALASLRSLADYYASGTVTLDLFNVIIDEELFINNRLLRKEDDTLHFLYEEVPQEKKTWH